jgi:hypothetical protein
MWRMCKPLECCLAVLLLSSCVLMTGQQATSAQKLQSTPQWVIEYHETGGKDGRSLHVTVNSAGDVTTNGGVVQKWKSLFQASPDQLAELKTLVNGLKLSGIPKPAPQKPQRPIPDMLYTKLEVTRGGQKYPVTAAPDRFYVILRQLLEEGRKRAENDKWQKAGAFKAGRVWHVQEEVRDSEGIWHGEEWDGTWARRGETNTFDAVWRNNKTGQEVRDTVELQVAERGRIALHRMSTNVNYSAWYTPEKPDQLTGYLSSCKGCSWRVEISY